MKAARSIGCVGLVAGAIAVSGCGAPGEDGSGDVQVVSSALLGWTPWVSDEQPAGTTCGNDPTAATAIACSGSYCDNMRLFCGTLPPGFVKGRAVGWSNYVSEEGGGPAVGCVWEGPNMPVGVIDGIRATGSFSDNISIQCSVLTPPPQGVNCAWSPWFSEEQGQMNFDVSFESRAGALAMAVRCSGSYCDNMSFYVCEPKCQTNADCLDTCNSDGVCVIS